MKQKIKKVKTSPLRPCLNPKNNWSFKFQRLKKQTAGFGQAIRYEQEKVSGI